MRFKLVYLVFATVVMIAILEVRMVNGDSAPKKSTVPWPIEDRRYFPSLEDLKSAWEKHEIFRKTYEGKVSDTKYVVIAASPYSGVDSIDVYLYISRGVSWRLHAVLFLTHSKTSQIDIKEKGTDIEFVHNGAVAATFPLSKEGQ